MSAWFGKKLAQGEAVQICSSNLQNVGKFCVHLQLFWFKRTKEMDTFFLIFES